MGREARLSSDIAWQDGMLLSAAHMQFLSKRMESLAFYYSRSVLPFNWGLRSLSIDESQIKEGIYCVKEIDAILPDGRLLQFFDETPISLKLPSNESTINVCIGLTPEAELDHSAYEEHHVSTGDPDVDPILLQKTRPKLSLLSSGESIGNRILLARICFSDGGFVQNPYFPPTLQIQKEGTQYRFIHKLLTDTRKQIWHLSKIHQQSSPSNLAQQLERKVTLHALGGLLLSVNAVLKAECHPFSVYVELCHVLGHMDVLKDELRLAVLPDYQHLDSYASFEDLAKHIRAILDGLSATQYNVYHFNKSQSVFRLLMQESWLTEPLILGLEIKNQKHKLQVIEWMSTSLIGDVEQIRQIKKSRTIGAARSFLSEPPADIKRENSVFFSVNPKHIKPERELIIINRASRAMAPDNITLYLNNGEIL